MNNDESLPYKLTMYFDGKEPVTGTAMNPQQLMWAVFQHFENFADDRLPVHSEYNQNGQLCFWQLDYAGDFPKEMFPLSPEDHPLVRAVIRNTKVKAAETYPLATELEIKNRRYVWASISDGVVVDWRDFESTEDKDTAASHRKRIIGEMGSDGNRVKSGMVKGRTFHVVGVPDFLRKGKKESVQTFATVVTNQDGDHAQ